MSLRRIRKRKSIFCNITVFAAKPPKNANFKAIDYKIKHILVKKSMNLHEIKSILTWTLLSVFFNPFSMKSIGNSAGKAAKMH